MTHLNKPRTRAQESRAAIERLYIAMRHLFIRGNYKPLGVSGEAMINSLKQLSPEIYGDLNDPERVELDGLLYIFQRLPRGIEECRFVRLISREGFENSSFQPIVPPKRRRNCYRIDQDQMYIEMTRGRSDIYDVLTHLTFMYLMAEKIRLNSQDHKGRKKREWEMLERIVELDKRGEEFNQEVAYTYLSTMLGRTYDDTLAACERFSNSEDVNSIFHITYWLGKLSFDEALHKEDREISFSSSLREKVGHHIYGESWAQNIKAQLKEQQLLERPIHIISANPHSIMNSLFAPAALDRLNDDLDDIARDLSLSNNDQLRKRVKKLALKNGMVEIMDTSGTNISVQIFDTAKMGKITFSPALQWNKAFISEEQPVILVMDYAFGEQAYETMDELLKPFEEGDKKTPIRISSVSIMGKAGILEGDKGDIMVPTAHVFEGTADNYPFDNQLSKEDFEGFGLRVFEGPMISVLGTSLQNKDILRYFHLSSWHAIGLEMEGAHYQKAIQAATKIRKGGIDQQVSVRYAYYASDNPLITGATLASGSLGVDGVKPTYLISVKILNQILGGAAA
ncbi:MAG: hypothetical protein KTR30_23200 [Saprospiraceae bacterium]|nr:hypothetical protein [Saprospiraceae bacterium]